MIGQHDDGLAVARHLHRALHNAVRKNIRPGHRLQRGALQLAGHPVAVRRQAVDAVDKEIPGTRRKSRGLGAGHRPQQRQTFRSQLPPGSGAPADHPVPQGAVQVAAAEFLPVGGSLLPGAGQGQHVPGVQRPAGKPAQMTGQVGGAAAPHQGHRDATPHRQVAAQPGACSADGEPAARRGKGRGEKGHLPAVQGGVGLGPRQGEDRPGDKLHLGAPEGGFQHGVSGVVADEQVGQPGGVVVGGPTAAEALGGTALPPQVLHGGQGAGVQHAQTHTVPSFWASSANRAAVMGTNRMRSPAA